MVYFLKLCEVLEVFHLAQRSSAHTTVSQEGSGPPLHNTMPSSAAAAACLSDLRSSTMAGQITDRNTKQGRAATDGMEGGKNRFKMENMCKTVLDFAGDTRLNALVRIIFSVELSSFPWHQLGLFMQFYFTLSPSAANEVKHRSESEAKEQLGDP